jgi:hypothetical protein
MLWILGLIFFIFIIIIFPEGLIAPLISFSIVGFILWLVNSKVSFKIKVPITILVLIGLTLGGYYWWTAPDREYQKYLEEERRRWAEWNTSPPTLPKDSIDYIIEDRLTSHFNDKIFAGISFGDNPATVKQKLKKYRRIYGDTIFLPTNSSPKKLVIGRIHQEYYKHKLYKLEICYNTNYVDSALLALYSSKYGKTKKRCWEFSNAKISFYSGSNKVARDNRGYKNDPILYYDYISGIITHDGGYGIIGYEDKIIEEQKRTEEEKERIKQDSIKRVKELEIENREKELANQQQQQI